MDQRGSFPRPVMATDHPRPTLSKKDIACLERNDIWHSASFPPLLRGWRELVAVPGRCMYTCMCLHTCMNVCLCTCKHTWVYCLAAFCV